MLKEIIFRSSFPLAAVAVLNVGPFLLFAQGNMTVKMVSPQNNVTFEPCADILLLAEATITDGTIKDVRFFRNGLPIGKKEAHPLNTHGKM